MFPLLLILLCIVKLFLMGNASSPVAALDNLVRNLAEDELDHDANENKHICPEGWKGIQALPTVMQHMQGVRPSEYNIIIPLTGLACLITGIVLLPTLFMLGNASGSKTTPVLQRRCLHIRIILATPLIIASLKFMAVCAPQFWHFTFVAVAIYEVVAFWCLFSLFLGFLGTSDEKVLDALAQGACHRPWAAPPLCCWIFCWPCMTPRLPQQMDLQICRVLLWQFSIIAPTASILEVICVSESLKRKLTVIDIGSLVVAVYVLFVVMKMLEYVVEGRRVHAKFWTLKGVIAANMMTLRIASLHMPKAVRLNGACYSGETLAAARASAAAALLCCVFAALGRYAFPKEDLEVLPEREVEMSLE